MRILKSVSIKNYRGIESAVISELADINILIGRNNTGKSSLLSGIAMLNTLDLADEVKPLCPFCKVGMNAWNRESESHGWVKMGVPRASIQIYDTRFEKGNFSMDYEFDPVLLADVLGTFAAVASIGGVNLKTHLRRYFLTKCQVPGLTLPANHFDRVDHLSIEQHGTQVPSILAEHASQFGLPGLLDSVAGPRQDRVLLVGDSRLMIYKEKKLSEYLKSLNLTTGQVSELKDRLVGIVDGRIAELGSVDFNIIFGSEYSSTLDREGSGVRSLVCLAADLVRTPAKIVLIDEPETGLHQTAKAAFVEFIKQKTVDKQFIVATHDPTFVNRLLYEGTDVAFFCYSEKTGRFKRVNLDENKVDPSVFSGYLPHTHSLNPLHIYVEGSQDVYIFRDMLRKFLRAEGKDGWWKTFEQVGVYHLGGDNWAHLAGTVPGLPYRSVLILDGNKKEDARGMCKALAQLEYCETPENLKAGLAKSGVSPVYCLQENDISKYFKCKAKKDAVVAALQQEEIPQELRSIFTAFLPG